MWRFRNLLSLQIAFTAGLPLLLLLIVGIFQLGPQISNQVEARHQAVAVAMAGQVEGYLFGAGRELETIARLLNRTPANDWQRILDAHVGNADIFNNILVVNKSGFTTNAGLPIEFRASRSNFIGIDVSRLTFYREMRGSGLPTWSDSYLSSSSGKLTVAYSVPLDNFSLVGEIALERLSDFIERISTRDQVEVMVIDGIGALVAHPQSMLTGQQLSLRNLDIVTRGLEGKTDFSEFQYLGRRLVGIAVPVQKLDWIVLVAQPYNIAYGAVTTANKIILASLIFGLALSAIGGLSLANWIARRFDLISENAKHISDGLYGLDWPESRVVEFNALGKHLQAMEDAIRGRERELEEQWSRFQTAFETSPLAMSIVEADSGEFADVNPAWSTVTGYIPDEIIGQSVDKIGIWVDADEGRQYRKLVSDKGTVREYETRLRRKSGEVAEVILNSGRISIAGGIFILNIIIDVTERNRLNRQLRSTEMLQAAILNNAGHAIVSATAEGTITTFNSAAEKMLGYTAEEMVGKQTPAVFHDPVEIAERAEQFSRELGREIEPGFEVFIVHSTLGLPNEYEWTYIHKDGHRFPVLLTITTLQDEYGEVTGYLGLAIDITQRKAAEARLRQSEQRLARQKLAIMNLARAQRNTAQNLNELIKITTKLLASSVEVGRASVWSYDTDKDAITCLDLYNLESDRHESGMTIDQSFNPEYFYALAHERLIVANDATTNPATRRFTEDYLVPNKIGAMLDSMILRGTEIVGVVCFEHVGSTREWTTDEQNFATAMADFISLSMELYQHQQTTEELQQYKENLEELVATRTRELESLNKELEAFSYSVSHDLRAPLRSIDGFSQAILEDYGDSLDDVAHDYLARVRNATQRMDNLIDDMLKLSQINRRDIHREQVNLSEISAEVISQLQGIEPGREIEVSIADNLVANGDANLLRVVMENLIGNAWKYTSKERHPRIEVGSEISDGTPAYFVRDNGIGFDMNYSGKLFGAFQRLHRPEDFPGSGIGLATVNRIINRHGGRIWAEAQPGKGAVFYFTTT